MRFVLQSLSALFLTILFTFVAPRLGPGPHGPSASTSTASRSSLIQPTSSQHKSPPAYSLPPEKLAKAIALSRIRNVLGFAGSLWGLAVLWLLLATRLAASMAAWTERLVKQRWAQGLVFFAVLILLLTVADLPLSIYSHSVSLGYGISVEGWGSWLVDMAKGLGLSLSIGTPVMLLFNWIVRRWPRRYWLAAWMVTLPLMVLGAFVSPLLEPIFNKFEPLAKSNPALVAGLEKVVARTGTLIPPERMFLMKASAKTNGLNAYVSGIGATKRIVVWDTTAGRIPDDEILFIFAHESGHYVLNHIPKGLTLTAVFLFFLYWACAALAALLARRFGPRWGVVAQQDGTAALSGRAGFVVLLFIVSAAQFMMEPVGNAFSRHIEHQADIYGQETIHGIVADPQKTAVAAFNHLGEAWLEDPNPSPFIEFWSYSHPSIENRANFAMHYDPWAAGGKPEFFSK
jgi:Zn-dependent protease with chaperone function